MATEKAKGYEFKHLECPQPWVQALLDEYGKFYWKLVGTQTVVAKESHLEKGGLLDSDSIYQVTTEERFATIDLKRPTDMPNLAKVRQIEDKYFQIVGSLVQHGCSPVYGYAPPPRRFLMVG